MNERALRNLGLELVRATEAAALAAGRWMGRGKAAEADQAATQAVCNVLSTIEFDARIAMGEESRYGACALHTGMRTGTGAGPHIDVVVDPIDGRALLARGHPGAIAAIAAAPVGNLWSPIPAVYMEKIVVDAQVAPVLVPECLDAPAAWTLALIAKVKGKRVDNLVTFVLDRPRHADLVGEIRAAGARVVLRREGDIAGALMALFGDGGVDLLIGVGGIIEGLITACAVKATRGGILGRLRPQSPAERAAVLDAGHDLARILTVDDMVGQDQVFFAATGITGGPLLPGVRYRGNTATSSSMILRSHTHTRRMIEAEHSLEE